MGDLFDRLRYWIWKTTHPKTAARWVDALCAIKELHGLEGVEHFITEYNRIGEVAKHDDFFKSEVVVEFDQEGRMSRRIVDYEYKWVYDLQTQQMEIKRWKDGTLLV